MKIPILFIVAVTVVLAMSGRLFAQAFGDYGRTLGGIPHTGPRAPGGANQGVGGNSGVGDIGGKGLASRLVVASKNAGLYPRQDDEAEVLARLTEGETLVPMVQSTGGNDWFMVKTQKGAVGWVKSADVREEKAKK